MSWLAIQTKAGREKYARGNVERSGHETYLPFCQNFRTRVVEPLFPRYLLVRKTQRWWDLRTTWGVERVVRRGEEPDEMPDGVVDQLREREDEQGLVQLDRPLFNLGCKVRAMGGAMIGQLGIYRGMSRCDRCEVMFILLGAPRVMVVSAEYLRAA